MESAIKMFPKGPVTKDKDGDEDDIVMIDQINIKRVTNGWVISSFYDDESEIIEVFDLDGSDNGNKQAVECIIESMGLQEEIKLK